MPIKNVTKPCLGCGKPTLLEFLDLGRTPLANSYVRPEFAACDEDAFPLAVCFCQNCTLVQLSEQVPPERMFSEYLYFSSFSDTFVRHAQSMAESLIERFSLGQGGRVLEVASNDGYLLQFFLQRGLKVLGIEPARNIAEAAVARGIPTMNRFFGSESAGEILHSFGPADLLIGNNVLAHVPAINAFLEAVARCLKPTGVAVFEFPYLGDLLDNIEFDTIYHEHVFYYSLTAVARLAERANLQLFDVEHQAIHGGSLRVFMQPAPVRKASVELKRMLEAERAQGFGSADCYASFGRRVTELKRDLLSLLGSLKSNGKRLAAYGAPAKGNTLLNYCGIGRDLLEFTVDRSPHKQQLLLPGSRLPIFSPDALLREKPDYVLILPWNITDEIVRLQSEYLHSGGHFIVPVPHPRVIDSAVIAAGR